MDDKVKKSYNKIQMSRDARERVYTNIMDSDGSWGTEDERRKRRRRGWNAHSGWRVAVATCLGLALLIPTGVYAAGKISKYFSVTIGQEKYQAKIKMSHSDGTLRGTISTKEHQGKESGEKGIKAAGRQSAKPEKYIKVKADFGKEYRYRDHSYDYYVDENGKEEKVKRDMPEGTDGMYEYSHRDGFEAGKDFYYNVIYMDVSEDAIMNLYDMATVKEIAVNGHKALLCQSNTVQGSRYASDYDAEYTIDVYVFYEEYGYVIDFCGMQRLGQKKLVSLAESASVTESTKEQASRYEYLSGLQKAGMQQSEEEGQKEKIISTVKGLYQKVAYDGLTCQVTDVTVSSQVKDTNLKKFNDGFFTEKSGYWDGKGKLKPYIREEIKSGDGVSQPVRSVTGTEKVQPKMVYVTMKVKAEKEARFELPMVRFLQKEKGTYYDNGNRRYWQYNRPEKIEDALIDFMPCYFKETVGGKGFWLKEMKKGEEQVYHFAYMVDEDLTDDMVLLFNASSSEADIKYVDIMR